MGQRPMLSFEMKPLIALSEQLKMYVQVLSRSNLFTKFI